VSDDLAGQPEEMSAEFGTVAAWTCDVIRQLGSEYAIPAACRGSGGPAALRWLGGRLALAPSQRILDCGAGLGGAAAFIAAEFGVRPVLAEPMPAACRAAAGLFGLPAVAATAQHLPFATGSFSTAWSLGVLCTISDQLAALTELRRVLQPGGRLGLIVYLQASAELPCIPAGNRFPREAELTDLLHSSGFAVQDQQPLAELGEAPAGWQRRADEVQRALDCAHSGQPRWEEARRQQECMALLLARGHVRGQLSCVVAR
jgi:SAM-dependent methyltransferase